MDEIDDVRMSDEEPLYNIGVVSRMTGIPETNLRIWERRYDFPDSARTAGGHRLYSQREVLRLQWVKQRVDEGMQISQAIRALQHMEREGRFPEAPLSPGTTPLSATPDDMPLTLYRERIVNALLAHDRETPDRILAEVTAIRPLEAIILEIIAPAFTAIGEAWEADDIGVSTEHFATHYLRQRLYMWMHTAPPVYPVNPVLLAAAPDEWHEGSLLLLGVLLRRLRWPVIYLGQAVPLQDLAQFVQETRPSIVVLVAMTEKTAATIREWPQWLDGAKASNPAITYGGWIYTQQADLVETMPGVYLGDTLREGVDRLNQMLREINPLIH